MPKPGPKPLHTVCTLPSCEKKFYAKGYCKMHYSRNSLGTTLERPEGMQERKYSRLDTACEGPQCDRVVWSKGVCRTHYMQRWTGQPLTVIRTHTWAKEMENGRVCTMCDELKPVEEYYKRETGIPQSRCKRCMVALASLRQAKRRGLPEPQWAVDYVNRYV